MSKILELQPGTVAEMNSTFDAGISVPLAPGVDIDALIDGDDDPMFVTIDALSDTISGNSRRWTSEELHRIAEQVMNKKVDGYQGHLKAEDRSSVAPDAVTIWLGATVAEHKGSDRLFIKGYVLPKAEQFRDYLKRAVKIGKNVAVSVYGQAQEKWNETLEAFEISNFNLESIDWARSGSEGVPNSGFVKITAEMDKGDEMTKEEALKKVTISEMKELNPTVVQEIEDQAQAELQSTISEMTETLGLKDSKELSKTVAEMHDENRTLKTQVAHAEVDKTLGSEVSNVAARKAVRKMVISEMKDATDTKTIQESIQTVLNSEEGKALVGSFKRPIVTPGGGDNRKTPTKSRFIKK